MLSWADDWRMTDLPFQVTADLGRQRASASATPEPERGMPTVTSAGRWWRGERVAGRVHGSNEPVVQRGWTSGAQPLSPRHLVLGSRRRLRPGGPLPIGGRFECRFECRFDLRFACCFCRRFSWWFGWHVACVVGAGDAGRDSSAGASPAPRSVRTQPRFQLVPSDEDPPSDALVGDAVGAHKAVDGAGADAQDNGRVLHAEGETARLASVRRLRATLAAYRAGGRCRDVVGRPVNDCLIGSY